MDGPGSVSGSSSEKWDWEKGKRTVLSSVAPKEEYEWQEETYVSPDGEKMTAVVRLEDESFTLRVNDEEWEESFEKAWYPRFSPDGRLTALVMVDDEWTVAVDGQMWDERFAFAWGTMFGGNGQICASIQQDMRYGLCIDGKPWDQLYENANAFSLKADGSKSCGVVQVKSLKQADLEGFRSGIYTVAVDGVAWDNSFMNVWTPVFDNREDNRVAAQVRLNVLEYSVVVNGKLWPATYNCLWEPAFNPADGTLAVPVRQDGRWGMLLDSAVYWEPKYYQCWQQQWSPCGKRLWAIVAPEFGKFTVACNNTPWSGGYSCISELTLSADGARAAALASHINADFKVIVDGTTWQGSWDMAWRPVFSSDGAHVAALVQKGSDMTYLVDNKLVSETFSRAWPPAFNADGSAVLLRGIQDNALVRIVLPLKDIA